MIAYFEHDLHQPFFFNGKSNEIYKYNKLKKCEGHLGKIDDNNKL